MPHSAPESSPYAIEARTQHFRAGREDSSEHRNTTDREDRT
jgi:hypothetical protein